MKIDFNFDEEQKIFYKHYSGEVTYNDFELTWMYLIDNQILPDDFRGLLIDCRKAVLAVETGEAPKISNFFKRHSSIFNNKKIAFVTSTPDQVVVSMLADENERSFLSKPFSTIEAAEYWIAN
jgi:hypothetical protein